MSKPVKKFTLRDANLRLCRLRTWSNFKGLGFNLAKTSEPPHVIGTVESNSPAAAGGLKINDIILEVNNKDVKKVNYKDLTITIKKILDKNEPVELLVVEKRLYEQLKKEKIKIDRKTANTFKTPPTMPPDYADFPKNTPRTCEVRLIRPEDSFGFEIVNGEKDIGAFIQEVKPNTPASDAGLRKSDRILEIDGQFVNDQPSETILNAIRKGKAKSVVKLYVMDTQTYKDFVLKNMPLQSTSNQAYMNVNNTTPDNVSRLGSGAGRRGTETSEPIDIDEPEIRVGGRTGVTIDRSSSPELATDEVSTSRRNPSNRQEPVSKSLPGISGLAAANPLEPKSTQVNSQSIQPRQYRLRRDPSAGYGFSVNSKQGAAHPHKITQIGPNTPAEKEGLKVGDYVLTVNNQNVEKMSGDQFKKFLGDEAKSAESRGELLLLGVINEDTNPPPTGFDIPPSRKPPSPVPYNEIEERADSEPHPEMRQCTIRPWPQYQELGFDIVQTPRGSSKKNGYQIKKLKPTSPAASTHICNDDYIIEVNGKNIENDDLDSVRDDIHSTYEDDGEIKLLVIDEDGYQWYNKNQYRIESIAETANIKNYTTPAPPKSKEVITTNRKNSSKDPAPIGPASSLYGNGSSATTEQKTKPSYGDNMDPEYGGAGAKTIISQPGTSSSLHSKSKTLSRGAIDVVSVNRLLRFCLLRVESRQELGFQLDSDDNMHIAHNIVPDSPAAKAGLREKDRLIEVNDENVEVQSNRDVRGLLKNAALNGDVRLLIAPHNIKPLTNRSAKSLTVLNDDRHYHDNIPQSTHNNQGQSSSTARYRSTSRLNGDQINHDQSHIAMNFSSQSLKPTEPLPRKCVLFRDSSFRGCGFRLIEKKNCDTPIVAEVYPNSPAKRSGLTEGDHIIYIESQNIQYLQPFNKITHVIQRTFEETGQVTLVTLTGPGYQTLKQRGGYLNANVFDYQLPNNDQMQPRLCKLNLFKHEYDFGFSLHRESLLCIDNVEHGSAADAQGLRKGDVVLELNGLDTKYLSIKEIKATMEKSKQERVLEILVIDTDGYQFSIKHAVPINSLLSFVQTREGRGMTNNGRTEQNAVYL